VAERARSGPLLYAAPWGGGVRIVVPHPLRAGPQRRAELAIDWTAQPAPALVLFEDGAPPRHAASLLAALGALGAFEAPQKVATVLRVLGAMKPTRGRRNRGGGASRRVHALNADDEDELSDGYSDGDGTGSEEEDGIGHEERLAMLTDALAKAVQQRRARKERAAAAAARLAAAEAAAARACDAAVALPSPRGTEAGAAPLPVLSAERRAAMLALPGADAAVAARAAADKLVSSLAKAAACAGVDADGATAAACDARVAMRALGKLIRCAGAEEARAEVRACGLFQHITAHLARADAHAAGVAMPTLRTSLSLLPSGVAAPGLAATPPPPMRIPSSPVDGALSPPRSPVRASVPPLRLAAVLPRAAPSSPAWAPPPPPSPGRDAPGVRGRSYLDLNEQVEAEEAAEEEEEAGAGGVPTRALMHSSTPVGEAPDTPSQRASGRVPRLTLPATPGSAARTQSVSAAAVTAGVLVNPASAGVLPRELHAQLLALLLALLVSADGETLQVDTSAGAPSSGAHRSHLGASPAATASAMALASPSVRLSGGGSSAAVGEADGAAERALAVLQTHLRGAAGRDVLPLLAPLAARAGGGAARLLRLCAPSLFTRALYTPRGRLGRGGFSTVYAADVAAPLGAAAPRTVALKVTDMPQLPQPGVASATAPAPSTALVAVNTTPMRGARTPIAPADAAATAAVAAAAAAAASARADASILRDVFAEVAALQRMAREAVRVARLVAHARTSHVCVSTCIWADFIIRSLTASPLPPPATA
jgi:hypothetical protein